MAKAPRARQKSKEEWEEQWPRIKYLHDLSWDVKVVAAQMELDYGFQASHRQYRSQLEKRGIKTNLRKAELDRICAYDMHRQQRGKKSSRYLARHKPVSRRTMARHKRRYGSPEPSSHKPSISYFECNTLQYDRDNPHVQQLIKGKIEPYSVFEMTSSTTTEDHSCGWSLEEILSSGEDAGLAMHEVTQDQALWDSTQAPLCMGEIPDGSLPCSVDVSDDALDLQLSDWSSHRLPDNPWVAYPDQWA